MDAHVLLIEDDPEIAAAVVDELRAVGHRVEHAADGLTGADARGVRANSTCSWSTGCCPGLDGIEVIGRLRAGGVASPVLVLSALSAIDDRVSGLKAGGDDYLTKPFAMPELLARVEALLRRPAPSRATLLRAGPLVLDLLERTARREQRFLDLLPREFKLLEYMARRPDRVLTRAMMLEDVWNYRFVPQTNLVDVHIGQAAAQGRCAGRTFPDRERARRGFLPPRLGAARLGAAHLSASGLGAPRPGFFPPAGVATPLRRLVRTASFRMALGASLIMATVASALQLVFVLLQITRFQRRPDQPGPGRGGGPDGAARRRRCCVPTSSGAGRPTSTSSRSPACSRPTDTGSRAIWTRHPSVCRPTASCMW